VAELTTAVEGINKGELFTSFDVDAFEVPHGRDELWRFTPLRRLRGLHDGSAAATGAATVEVQTPDGVWVDKAARDDSRLGQAGAPADRVAAQAYSSFETATLIEVPKDTVIRDEIQVTVTGPGEGKVAYGHLQVRVGELSEAVVTPPG
jgi:Fe-S cluster assembly protein SufD